MSTPGDTRDAIPGPPGSPHASGVPGAPGAPGAPGTPAGQSPPPVADADRRPRPADRRAEAVVAYLARQQRPFHERDLSIGRALGGIRRDVASRRRRLGELVDPWENLVPEAIKIRARVDGLRGDTLMVTVDSAATSWQLDRLLRSGLTQSLARASRDRVRRVRVRVGEISDPRNAPRPGPPARR
jgi:hypothetical protein